MKLPKSIKIKETVSLFANKYKYKIVLVCPVAGWFRGNKLDFVLEKLTEGDFPPWIKIKTKADLDYCFALQKLMSTFSDYELRVESPLINFYTNTTSNLEKLAALDDNRVKFICLPSKGNPELEKNSIIVKTLDYNYKLHLGATKQEYASFVKWCEDNDKIRLPKRAKLDLSKTFSWGGAYFYVKDDKTLTMVRMFLGTAVSKIETVIKA
jgi:hypothetical protein